MSILIAASKNLTNIEKDLGCVPIDLSVPSSYGDATATENTSKINTFMADFGTSKFGPLFVPNKWFAINDTLGTVSGGPPNTSIGLPSNLALICAGGSFNGAEGLAGASCKHAGGLVWVGADDRPMIRLTGYGNVLQVNLMGYQFVWMPPPNDLPPSTRAQTGIEIYRLEVGSPAGKHLIGGTIMGCASAIKTDFYPTNQNNADESHFTDLNVLDCLNAFWSTCSQSVEFQFDRVRVAPPRTEQSTVFKFTRGGKIHVDFLSIVGTYGVTVLETPEPGGGDTNVESYVFDYLDVDRALLDATKAGDGYLRLVDQKAPSESLVRMTGHFSYANENLDSPWYNLGGEPIVVAQPHGDIQLDIAGLDHITAAAYQKRPFRGADPVRSYTTKAYASTKLWIDPLTLAGYSYDNAEGEERIATIADRSGTGNVLTQATSSNQPVLLFGRNNQSLNLRNTITLQHPHPASPVLRKAVNVAPAALAGAIDDITIMAVVRLHASAIGTALDNIVLSCMNSGNTAGWSLGVVPTGVFGQGRAYFQCGPETSSITTETTAPSHPLVEDKVYLLIARRDSATKRLYLRVDDLETSAPFSGDGTTLPALTGGQLVLGGRGSIPWRGSVGEIFVDLAFWEETDWKYVERRDYLRAGWAVQ